MYLLTDLQHFKGEETDDFQESLSYFARDNLICTATSRVFMSLWSFREYMQQADVALEYGMLYSPERWSFRFDTYVFSYVKNHAAGRLEKKSVCSNKILTLINHDKEKGTEYYRTLHMYFQCRFNSSETAKKLFIQRSTFQYRMDRIIRLTGLNLTSFEELSHCYISFGILEDDR
ncbi:MAG: helix-turn-helix domain-containing protein [Lachnospiraceae bacterium]|nr:helix-turn-helix domain-containing protein [Lachnospiraceae bacterium]